MIRLVICDDERVQLDYLHELCQKWSSARSLRVSILMYESAESFLFEYQQEPMVDILLLDIQMKGMDGLCLARQIREVDDHVQIIFITGYPEFMADGYEVSALHYLMKPVNEDKLVAVLDKALARLDRAEKAIWLAVEGERMRLLHKSIRFVEAQGHYLLIHTAPGRQYRVKMNLSDLEAALGEGFFRCQRSFMVNLACIERITRTAIILDDQAVVPLARGLYEQANRAVIEEL